MTLEITTVMVPQGKRPQNQVDRLRERGLEKDEKDRGLGANGKGLELVEYICGGD